ncbi:hypothetical protein [Nonomuraea sp. NPDC050310]|uniref:nSTAND1 domain-containing NTPase n=1 Tax=Nonomuraea sp. NPDC050310 TaxID=3154935 RepID=UPI0033EAE321
MTALRAGDPARLGQYWLAGRLGDRGEVFDGYDEQGRRVAITLGGGDATSVAGFCTARMIEARPEHTPPFTVSEFVPGPDLTEAGVFGGDRLRRLAIGTATALVAIHEAGLAHGALKPSSVVLGPAGPRVVGFAGGGVPAYPAPETRASRARLDLADDGPARGTRRDGPGREPGTGRGIPSARETGRGEPFGRETGRGEPSAWESGHGSVPPAPGWTLGPAAGTLAGSMAERWFPSSGRRAPEAAADVFAWGALMIYAATGRDPMPADPAAVPEIPRELEFPEPLHTLVAASLSRSPAQRPTARELLLALLGSWDLHRGVREAAPLATAPEPPLGERAEELFAALPEAVQRQAPRAFLRLVSPRDLSARRAPRAALPRQLLDAYREAGLLAVEGETVKVTAPALPHAWPRLRAWLADERERRATRRRVAEAQRRRHRSRLRQAVAVALMVVLAVAVVAAALADLRSRELTQMFPHTTAWTS